MISKITANKIKYLRVYIFNDTFEQYQNILLSRCFLYLKSQVRIYLFFNLKRIRLKKLKLMLMRMDIIRLKKLRLMLLRMHITTLNQQLSKYSQNFYFVFFYSIILNFVCILIPRLLITYLNLQIQIQQVTNFSKLQFFIQQNA